MNAKWSAEVGKDNDDRPSIAMLRSQCDWLVMPKCPIERRDWQRIWKIQRCAITKHAPHQAAFKGNLRGIPGIARLVEAMSEAPFAIGRNRRFQP